MINILIETVSIILILVTILPLLPIDHWIVRDLDFPRLQFLTLIGTILLLQIVTNLFETPLDKILLFLTLGSGVYQAWWVVKYSRLMPLEVLNAAEHEKEYLSILSSNVLMDNRRYGDLLDRIKKYDPDIIVTLETNIWWQEKLKPLEKSYPYLIQCPLENLYGMHVYSKYKLHNAEIKYLVEEDKPSIHAFINLKSGATVRLHFLHPAPPSPSENKTSKERDIELLLVAKSLSETDEPAIVAGDLNDVAWSKTTCNFRKISGLLDPRVGRGTFNTFHAKYWFLRWPLDHLFHSKHFTLVKMQRLKSIGSDHFPLFTKLAFSPLMKDKQQAISATEADKRRSEEKIDEKGIDKKQVPNPT